MKTACFTGHRNAPETLELLERLTKTLEELITQGCTDFYAGGALGWDMLCAETVLNLREQHPSIRLHLVLPCPPMAQTRDWEHEERHRYMHLLKEADSFEFTSDSYTRTCMKKRNARLVELADCCVCYYKAARFRSGTGQTVRMAEKKGIPVHNLAQA